MAVNSRTRRLTQPIESETPESASGSGSQRSSRSSSTASPQHKLISFPEFKDHSKRSWTVLFAGKKRCDKKPEANELDSQGQPVQDEGEDRLERLMTRCVKLSIEDHTMPQAAASASPTRLADINRRTLKIKKQPFDANYPERNSRRPLDPLLSQLRETSKLRRSVVAEDVEYPDFPESRYRWTQATTEEMTAYDALSEYVSSLAQRYNWEDSAQQQTLSPLKPLQPRDDIVVPVGLAYPTLPCEHAEVTAMTSAENGVRKIRVLLARMAARMDSDKKAASDRVVGRHDVRKVIKHRQYELDVIKSVVKAILEEK